MNPEAIRQLYEYSYWAWELVWGCIQPLTDAQFTQELDYSVGSIRNQLVHVMSAELRWMKRIAVQDTPPWLPFEDYPTIESVRAKWGEVRAEVLAYVTSLDQDALDEKIAYSIAARDIDAAHRRWELLAHVANHATDHRAQVLALLHHHFGVATVEQDMLFYLLRTDAL